jgi:hypothetical protein
MPIIAVRGREQVGDLEKNSWGYAGTGIARLTLIDSMVSATIRHSESEPIASEAATALVNRDEATGGAWPSKPAARGDRVMAGKS